MGSVPFEHIEPWVLARKIWFRFQHIKLFQLIDFRPSCEMSEANNQQWHALYGVRVNIASHDHPNTMCQFFGMWSKLESSYCRPRIGRKSNPGSPYVSFLYVRTQTWKVLSTFPWTATCDLHTLLHYAILHGSVYPLSQNHPGAGPKLPEAKISQRATSWTYSWTDTVAMALKLRLLLGNTTH